MLKFIVLFFAAFAVFSPLFLIGIRRYTGQKARRALGANIASFFAFLVLASVVGIGGSASAAGAEAAAAAGGMAEGLKYVGAALAVGLSGIGGGIYYLAGTGQYVLEKSILGMGFNGIPVALLASSNPIGTIFASLFISYIQVGGAAMQPAYSSETIDIVIAVIIYLAAFALLMRGIITKAVSGHKGKEGAAK